VYPEHKYLIVEALRQEGFAVGMTGDGVNDAPALKRADVGIAVEGATDAARAAADMVLTQPGLSVIVEGIRIARCIFLRMKNFINYRCAAGLRGEGVCARRACVSCVRGVLCLWAGGSWRPPAAVVVPAPRGAVGLLVCVCVWSVSGHTGG
jgi:hypothetical protein